MRPRRVASGAGVHTLQEHAHLAKLSFLMAQSARLKSLLAGGGTGWAVIKARLQFLSQSGLSRPNCALRSIPFCSPEIWCVPVRLSFHRLLTPVKAVTKDQRENLPAGRLIAARATGLAVL